MDYEKKYKEAFERAKRMFSEKELNYLFPELKESEDEKIKRMLIDYFKEYKENENCGINTFNRIPTDNILSWLEKQGEERRIIMNHEKKYKNAMLLEQNAILQELKALHLRMEHQTVCNDAGGNKMWSRAWRLVNEAINVIKKDKETFK